MWLIFLCYLLMASTFTIAKTALFYMQPVYFIAFRMIIAGIFLLSYLVLFKPAKLKYNRNDIKLFLMIIIFHIYCAYILEFWALQYMKSAKVCLLYNLSPFITAFLSYFLFKKTLSLKKWVALIAGFASMLPIIIAQSAADTIAFGFGFLSLAEGALLLGIASASYGWLVMKELVFTRKYSTLMVNGWGMLIGGIACLITAFIVEGFHPFILNSEPTDLFGAKLLPHLGIGTTSLVMAFGCMMSLILIANIIGYNLYASLLRQYSATFLSFAGFITPFFASIFGWIFLKETLTAPFFISLFMTMISLYFFYQDELRDGSFS